MARVLPFMFTKGAQRRRNLVVQPVHLLGPEMNRVNFLRLQTSQRSSFIGFE